ncbi:hypothetical protein CDIK_2216 [Cucumispora dikerogammari]|nr:hypothetical protein CDIK_2216 [Cucumispora dikerogammari]
MERKINKKQSVSVENAIYNFENILSQTESETLIYDQYKNFSSSALNECIKVQDDAVTEHSEEHAKEDDMASEDSVYYKSRFKSKAFDRLFMALEYSNTVVSVE